MKNLGKILMKMGLVLILMLILPSIAQAATGDILRQIQPTPGGTGRGVAFNGAHLYYTLTGDTNIYETDVFGNPIATIPTPFVNGIQPQGGPLAWDGTNLWIINYGTNGDLIQLTPKGTLVSTCNIITTNPGHPALKGLFLPTGPDGLDWTGIPGSEIVLSGEGESSTPNSVVFMNTSCKIQSWFTATLESGFGTSGVAFDGQNLWQAYPLGPGDFVTSFIQTNLSGVDTGLSFGFSNFTATIYNLAAFEDIAYDSVTFAPKCTLWANDQGIGANFTQPPRTNNITAFEVPCGPKGSISGTKFNDLNGNGKKDPGEPGLANWTIILTNETGSITTTTTDASGNYSFTNLSNGNYTVGEVQQVGWIQTAPAAGNYTVTFSGANITGQDFGNKRFSIFGMKFNDLNGNRKKDPGEPGLAGWHIKLVGADTLTNIPVNREEITDVNGNYGFTDVSPGIYQVFEVMQGPNWVPTTPVTVPIVNKTAIVGINVNFGNKQVP